MTRIIMQDVFYDGEKGREGSDKICVVNAVHP